MHIDLDAARRERAANYGPPPTVTVAGREYTLVHELPLAFVEHLGRNEIREALTLMLVDRSDIDAFMASDPTSDDLRLISESIYAQLRGGEMIGPPRANGKGH